MPFLKVFLLLTLLTFAGCYSRNKQGAESGTIDSYNSASKQIAEQRESEIKIQTVSLDQADQSQSMVEAMNRTIVRNPELTFEVSDPNAVQSEITSIAESVGGFVVTSESKHRQSGDSGNRE